MKAITFEEIKVIQLQILVEVARFCESYGIKYSLAYGTLIGAVRHNGYIPWDDDIDIMMPREDYNYFLILFNKEHSHLKVIAPELNPNFYATYANVYNIHTLLKEDGISHRRIKLGVKIDVFPMDYVSNDLNIYKKQLSRAIDLNYKMLIKRHLILPALKCDFLMGVKILLKKIIYSRYSYKALQRMIKKNSMLCPDSDFIDNIVFRITSTKMTRIPKTLFDDFSIIQFEGYNLRIIKNYDAYLRPIYGDYMRLPPVEEQAPSHGFEAYWVD